MSKFIKMISVGIVVLIVWYWLSILTERVPVTKSNLATSSESIFDTTTVSIPNMIAVTQPAKNAKVESTFIIAGSARGPWYFEGSFPVEVQDAKGTVLYQGPIMAEGEWMTESFVPFIQEIALTQEPQTSTGIIILKKDDPSGEHPAQLEIPIRF